MAKEDYRPPKVVISNEQNIQRPEHSGGGSPKMFGEIEEAERNELTEPVVRVHQHFQSVFQDTPDLPCVARVRLKEKASAKSHRELASVWWTGFVFRLKDSRDTCSLIRLRVKNSQTPARTSLVDSNAVRDLIQIHE